MDNWLLDATTECYRGSATYVNITLVHSTKSQLSHIISSFWTCLAGKSLCGQWKKKPICWNPISAPSATVGIRFINNSQQAEQDVLNLISTIWISQINQQVFILVLASTIMIKCSFLQGFSLWPWEGDTCTCNADFIIRQTELCIRARVLDSTLNDL